MAPVRRRSAQTSRAPARRRPQRPTAIVNLQDTDYTLRMRWLVYGGSGVGKSVLAGTAPRSLLLSTEPEGAASAKALGSTADELRVENWREFLDVTDWLEHEGHKDYSWVSLDGITELEEHAWNAIMAGGKLPRSVAGGFRQRSRNDYPLVWDALRRQVDRYNRMPINVLYTAQTMRIDAETEDGDDTTLLLPLVGSTKRGDLATRICGTMTLVGLYRKHRDVETGKVARRLHTQDSERWVAKDRHDTFGRWVNRPNIAEMEAAVLERLSASGERKAPARKRTNTRRSA